MPAWCLSKRATNKFLEMLKENKIKPDEIADMTSKGRRAFFAKSFGEENAKQINALFESKLLLKNQKQGMITWAKKTAGLTEPARRDIISRINRMEKFLDPKEEQAFLEDLASQKLGLDVTQEEAKKIFDLTSNIAKLEEKSIAKGLDRTEQLRAEIDYGNALLDFEEYIATLKKETFKVSNLATNIGTFMQGVMTSFDVSAPRQLWGMLSVKDFWKQSPKLLTNFSSKSYKENIASILGSPQYKLSQSTKDNKLAITRLGSDLAKREDDVMSSWLEKIPIIKQSAQSFIGTIDAVRFERFKTLIRKAELRGEDISAGSQTIDDINRVINIFTARGNLGKGDRYRNVGKLLNVFLWSPRKIAADIQMFLNPKLYIGGSKTARRAALRQLIGSLSLTAAVLGLASSLGLGVELDPRSADFGKVKIGKNRIDFTAGKAAYVRLLARLITNTTKTVKGRIHKLGGGGYKPTTRGTIIANFSRNKLAPMAGLFADHLFESDFLGRPVNLFDKEAFKDLPKALRGSDDNQTSRILAERMRPMTISTIIDMANSGDKKDIIAFLTLLELFGFGVQTYD